MINKMFGKKRIAALAALIIILGSQMAMGKRVAGTVAYRALSASLNFLTVNAQATVLAQNDKPAAEDKEKSKSESGTNGSEAAADDEKKSSNPESKPLKPFVPSEKIQGEQAVDFPVDI